MHYLEQKSDTGLELNLLQKYLLVPLDIFKKNRHNKAITNKVDAWLTFLCKDEPEEIEKLITAYPEFKPMYEDIYGLCRNTERVMSMFSKELQILDANTVQYMIDEMQDTIDEQKEQLEEKDRLLKDQAEKIRQLQEQINAGASV